MEEPRTRDEPKTLEEHRTRTAFVTAMMRSPPLWRDCFRHDEIAFAVTRSPLPKEIKLPHPYLWQWERKGTEDDNEGGRCWRQWKRRELRDLRVKRSKCIVRGAVALGFWCVSLFELEKSEYKVRVNGCYCLMNQFEIGFFSIIIPSSLRLSLACETWAWT